MLAHHAADHCRVGLRARDVGAPFDARLVADRTSRLSFPEGAIKATSERQATDSRLSAGGAQRAERMAGARGIAGCDARAVAVCFDGPTESRAGNQGTK
jgi:hypothetical protein